MTPEIVPIEEDFYVLWREQGVGLTFGKLRETDSGQVRGHVTAEAVPPATPAGHISWTIMALDQTAPRDRLAKEIGRVCPGLDWGPQINRACQEVARRFCAPKPLIRLKDVEVPEASEYLFSPLMPRDQITVFYADQQGSKSYLLALLSVCTALGIRPGFLKEAPLLKGPVIYWDWETDERAQRKRFGYVCRGLGVEFPDDIYYQPMQGRLTERARDMRQEIAKARPVLVVTDSLTFSTGGNLNDTDSSGPTMNAIGGLGPTTKAVSAHFRKSSRGEEGPASVMGSALFEFKARALWEMRREGSGGPAFNVGLFNRKMSDDVTAPNLAYRMAFDNAAHLVTFTPATVDATPELERHLPPRQRLINLLTHEPLGIQEIADRTGLAAGTVKKELNAAPTNFMNLNRSAGGRGKAGLWVVRTPERTSREAGKTNRSPYRETDIERFPAGETGNRSQENRSKPFCENGYEDDDLRELPF